MDYEKIIDMMIEAKMEWKEYKELESESHSEEEKMMFKKLAEQEHDNYHMLKEYLKKYLG